MDPADRIVVSTLNDGLFQPELTKLGGCCDLNRQDTLSLQITAKNCPGTDYCADPTVEDRLDQIEEMLYPYLHTFEKHCTIKGINFQLVQDTVSMSEPNATPLWARRTMLFAASYKFNSNSPDKID